MVSKEEFINYCDTLITEDDIKKYKKNKKLRWIWLTIVWLIMIIGCVLIAYFEYDYILGMVFAGTFLPILTITVIRITEYKWEELKHKNINNILDYMLGTTEYSYNEYGYIGVELYNTTSFKLSYDDYSTEDQITINIPNDDNTPSKVNLRISDYTLYRKDTDDKGKEDYTTIYQGMLGHVIFPFKFKCNLSLNTRLKGCEKIKLESIQFNKHFDVYTDNQIEALYILTPSMMTKLLQFEKRTPGGIKLELRKNGLMVFNIKGNLLEIKTKGIKKPCGKIFSRFYDDIAMLVAMVEEIKNNNRVFKM